jgi:signal transduction histidine kinase
MAVFSLWAVPGFAAETSVNVKVEGATDMCPNIDGVQIAVPNGMLVDTGGNCYTPTPPVDLCRNIPGVQSVLPEGYYRTADSECYPQPEEPIDVCLNLEGVQAAVPEGYYLDIMLNVCLPVEVVPPPVSGDVCLNIPGVQYVTPEGMVNENGRCYTPVGSGGDFPLKNVPDFLQPFMQRLVDFLPESVREFFRDLPEGAAEGIPVYVFILILILVLIPIWQSIREAMYARRLMAIFKRERNIAEEKDNFIALTGHYLRTPITIMQESLKMMMSGDELSSEGIGAVAGALSNLNNNVSASLNNAQSNLEAQFGGEGIDDLRPAPFYKSGFFWLPIGLSIILTLIVNFLLGVVGDKEIGVTNVMWQAFLIIVFIVLLYLIVRNYQIQRKLKERNDQLVAREAAIDGARNEFIAQEAGILAEGVRTLSYHGDTGSESAARRLYDDGLAKLSNIYSKFILLQYIQTNTSRAASEFNLRDAVGEAIIGQENAMEAKRVTVRNDVENVRVVQNRSLFGFVIGSLLDNAIKFSGQGGRVLISSGADEKTIKMVFSDNGSGMDSSKINQLFKPFSRAESAVNFNYEGLGLSLFLDRLILDYTGGSIEAATRLAGGTDITVTSPRDIRELFANAGEKH